MGNVIPFVNNVFQGFDQLTFYLPFKIVSPVLAKLSGQIKDRTFSRIHGAFQSSVNQIHETRITRLGGHILT